MMWSFRLSNSQPIDYTFWLMCAANKLNIQPSEVWKMPFFVVSKMVHDISGVKEEMNRAEALDAMRERKQRLGWV
jgi:hypothetical protein